GFSAKERRVELTGEAYFEVAKRTSQPFHVQTGAMDVEVLGTHFNVNAYSNESQIQTTLIEGSVRVNIDHVDKAILEPGQQAQVPRADMNTVHVKKDIDVNQVIAWQTGFFKFRNADLALIARQLSRWYNVDVETEEKLTELKLGGGISKKLQLSDVLTLLEANGAKYKWENGKVKLYSL
ncbi:MAG: FecR domain-containing protein, partial [Flavitalea sp.]